MSHRLVLSSPPFNYQPKYLTTLRCNLVFAIRKYCSCKMCCMGCEVTFVCMFLCLLGEEVYHMNMIYLCNITTIVGEYQLVHFPITRLCNCNMHFMDYNHNNYCIL